MTIEIDENSYIVGIWFSSNPDNLNNWLACVIRDPKNPDKYKGWSRFRYANDDKIFDSDDNKSWTVFTSQENHTEDDLINFMDLAQSNIEPGFPEKDRVIVKGDAQLFRKLAKGKPWMHMKEQKI